MSEQHPILEAYLNGELDEQGYIDLNAWLHEDPEHLREFAVASFLAQELGEALSEQASDVQPVVTDKANAAKQGQMDAEVLAQLAQLEAQADAETVTLVGELPTNQSERLRSISAHDVKAAGVYLLRHTFTPKRVAMLATAAAVLLGAVLAIVLLGGPEPVTEVAQTPDEPVIESKPIVATLTATHNAQWDSQPGEDLRPGTPLAAGQRLNLTAGFAEITTGRGAVAILQAPATVELLDSPNAIRLHAGKLVGICETESAKGFVVHTTNAVVIDLGTEFGVEVERTGETSVFVFDGLVALAPLDVDPRTAELTQVTAGQGKYVDRAGQITMIDPSSTKLAFVRSANPDARYEQLVLADKPLVYYRMDPFIGGIARNIAADRYHAKVFGGSETVTDGQRRAVSLSSLGDYLQTTEPIAELRAAESYTIECWVKLTRHDFGMICMFSSNNPKSQVGIDSAAQLETTGPGGLGLPRRIRLRHTEVIGSERDEPVQDQITEIFTPETPAISQWIHIAAIKDAGQIILYLNGEKVSEASVQTPLIDRDLLLTIGRFSTAEENSPARSRQFIGALDELAVYDHALPPDAVRARFDAGQFWLADE